MRRQGVLSALKKRTVLIAISLCLSTYSPVVYAANDGSEFEEVSSDSEDYSNIDDMFYDGMDKLAEDPYQFDFSRMPSGYKYRVGDFICEGTILLSYVGKEKNVIIPEGITRLGREGIVMDGPFKDDPIVSVTFPSTLKSAGSHSFTRCKNLKTVNMNSNLEEIGSYCFAETSLESVTIPASVKLVEAFAFSDSEELKKVNIQGKNIRFDQDVFRETPFLNSLFNKDKVAIVNNYLLDAKEYKKDKFTVPSQVTSIAGAAFFPNYNIEEIVMHDNVKLLGNDVFRSCVYLKKIKMSKKLTTIPYWAFVGCDYLKEIIIPASVTSVESGAFYDISSLSKINILTKTTNFEGGVFDDTGWLKIQQEKSPYVVINGVLIDATAVSGKAFVPNTVKIINDEAFAGNEKVTEIIIPDTVVRIDKDAFWSCTNLKNIDLGNSVKKIGESAFSQCESLTKVIFPDSVEELGQFMFFESNSVEYIRLPARLKRLEHQVLAYTLIKSVVIPSSVTFIDEYAMYACENLDKFYISSDLEKDSYIIGGAGSSENTTIYYPQDENFDWLNEYVGEVGSRISQPNYSLNYSELTLYTTWYEKQLQLEDEFQRYILNTDVIWKSNNTNVATINNGKIKPVSKGTAIISATYENKTYTCKVTVKEPSLNKTSTTLNADGWFTSKKYDHLLLTYAKSTDVKWTTSNKAVVAVSKTGTIEAKKKGVATITATVGGKKYTCKVTVKG